MYVCVGATPSATPRGVGTAILVEARWMRLTPGMFFVVTISTRAQRYCERRKESPKRFLATTAQLYHHGNVIKREPRSCHQWRYYSYSNSSLWDIAKDSDQNRLGKFDASFNGNLVGGPIDAF